MRLSRVFLTGLTAALYACAAAPPPSNSPTATVEAGHALELNAVFWADKIHHRSNAWQRHQETFTFRLENIAASQVLELISRELQLGYEMDGCGDTPVSLVGRDMPLQQVIESLEFQAGANVLFEGKLLSMRCEVDQLRVYTLDYLSIARQMNDSSSLSSAIAGGPRELTDRRETGNRSELVLNNSQQHDLWQDISSQIEQIIQVQPKPIELSRRERVIDEEEDRTYASTRNSSPRRLSPNLKSATAVSTEKRDITTTRKETRSGRVIANPESGTISVIAKPSQHRRVVQWLEQIQRRVDRQIVIEAVITEISLNDRYERGIDWNVLRQNGVTAGLAVQGLNLTNPAFTFTALRNTSGADTNIALRLLEEFGRTEVLSSPRVVTMNQQAAVLKVIDNRVYFTTDVQTSAPTQNSPAFSTFTTQVQTVPVGFLMTVTPQIADNNAIQLRVRPTLSRIVGFVQDPNPALQQLNIVSKVPEVQTRELESILRLKSGEMALLGGLRQKENKRLDRGIPGTPESIDLITQSQTRGESHIELVILLKATVLESATASQLEPGQELGELNKALADGLTLYQANQTKALNALLALLMKRYPDTPEPFYNMALHQSKQGLFTDALAHLAQAEAQCEYKQCSLPLLTVRSLIQAKIQ
ncbi:type II secretion system protein GspD [Limnobacter sp.]|uniref:type II secretion system protein GspD n=1 Tax=Limnobacter sp. TaxID=2003368 RepID=UPI003748328D